MSTHRRGTIDWPVLLIWSVAWLAMVGWGAVLVFAVLGLLDR